jgi:hypothetical protein
MYPPASHDICHQSVARDQTAFTASAGHSGIVAGERPTGEGGGGWLALEPMEIVLQEIL